MEALTAVEKIMSEHAGRTVRAGELSVVTVDAVMAQDGNAPLAIQLLHDELGTNKIFDASKVILVIDHCAPSPNDGAANLQSLMRAFAIESGAILYDAGEGISHVLLPEKGHALPGGIIVGSDSHTVTYGAVNCLGLGMGSTDITVAMHTGKAWLRVPETIRINLLGRLASGVTAKDLILHLIRMIGVSGATYKCLEIAGEGLATLNMDHRFTICNMVIEMGAKCAIMPVDDACSDYLNQRLQHVPDMVWSDPDCTYEVELNIDLGTIEPLVALPHDLTCIIPAREIVCQPVDIVFIGTCTNGRLSDLEETAVVLSGRRIHPNVRLIVAPGSRNVYLKALRQGVIEEIVRAGGIVTPPGCGPCVGTHLGIPGNDEVVISTANRNFKGRMGNAQASIFLASPITAATSAIVGRIATQVEVG